MIIQSENIGMKGLFLYGLNCQKWIWNTIKERFSDYEIDYVEYPHEEIQKAESVSDLTKWVNEYCKDKKYDFIVGHSMGGIIALELVAAYGFDVECVVLLETNLKPANAFYRNLMLPENMKKYGEPVMDMIKTESVFCGEKLVRELQEDFDYTPYLDSINGRLFGIYGDRGKKDYDKKFLDFCLDEDTLKRIQFKFVRNACHLPMIEAPDELAELILDSFRESGLI